MDDLTESLNAAMAALDSYGFSRAAETVERASTEIDRLRAENEATRSALVDAAQKQKEEQSKTLAAVDRLRKESDALIAMHSALRAENERLKADAARQADPGELANAFARGHDEGINDCLRNGLDWAHEYMGGQPGKRAKSEQHLSRAERLLAAMQSVIDACDGSYETPGEYGVQVARAIEDMLAAMAQGKV